MRAMQQSSHIIEPSEFILKMFRAIDLSLILLNISSAICDML